MPKHALPREPRRTGIVVLALALLALGLVTVPSTFATKTSVPRYRSASLLPATPSAKLAPRVLRRPVADGSTSSAAGAGRFGRSAGRLRALSGSAPPVAYPTGPANGFVSTSTTPTLSVGAVLDPEGDTVSYRFKVTTNSDAETGTIVADTFSASPSFTLPAGALQDGVTYFWHVTTSDPTNTGSAPGWVQAFRIDLRLGSNPSQPYDSVGPVSVNLTNGNLVLGASTASVDSLAGPVGVSLAYNSQAPSAAGLLGTYTLDANGNHTVDAGETPSVVRRDPSLAFDWGSGPPAPGMTSTNVIAKWTGVLTLPDSGTDSFKFGAITSGGIRIRVNGTTALDEWTTHTVGTTPIYPSNGITLTKGSPVSLSIDWFQGSTPGAVLKVYVMAASLSQRTFDPSWLAAEAGPLPSGWTLSPSGGGGLGYVRAEISGQQVVLFSPDGSTHVFTSTGSGFTPPKDEDGVLAYDTQARLTLDATDGTTYVFDANGLLVSATSSSGMPASHTYRWTTPSGSSLPRLTGITDPASGRSVSLSYVGDGTCPSGSEALPSTWPSGFDNPGPVGKLCAVNLWDGRKTRFWYSNGQLGRIENPGGSVTDIVNDAQGRPVKIRDPLASDMVASAARTDSYTWTDVHYDSSNRVDHVTLAAPTVGAARPGHQYGYTSGTGYVYVDGLTMPLAWARQVSYDAEGRVTSDTDATGRTSLTDWNANGLVWGTTDPAGLRTTYLYDWAGRRTGTYGPAPAGWFYGIGPTAPYASQVPYTETAYDAGMAGLDALYFANQTWTGAPAAHTFGVPGVTDGTLHGDFGTTVPVSGLPSAWSGRFTGEIVFPAVGTYTMAPNAMGPTRIWVDDTKVVDTATAATGTYANAVASSHHRLRVEYSTPGGSSQVTYNQVFAYTGGAQTFTVPGGVSSMTVETWGAKGARKEAGTPDGGEGGYARADLVVSPGESLQVNVGGTGACGFYNHSTNAWVAPSGGWNGGGAGSRTGCGGGGASDVRQGGTTTGDRKVVGGGGGGGSVQELNYSNYYGGAGGGTTGGAGTGGATGGTQLAGGAAGSGGTSGQFGIGGNAGAYEDGGGGGGGWYGGGGGYGNGFAGGSGGGGSGHATGTGAVLTNGGRSGNGQVKVSWTLSASLDLHWTPPGGTDVRVPGANLAPRYGLVTRSTDADGRAGGSEYANPELGVPTASVADPDGTHPLRTLTAYEPSGYRRATSRTLPLGGATSYGYYGGTPTVPEVTDVPCPSGPANINQGRRLKSTTGPSGRIDERVYDDAGRVVASRVHTDSVWSCVTYDARDRVIASRDRASHSSSVSYAPDGTVTSTSLDSAGVSHSTTSTVDLLGRTLTYTDELGTTTRVAYDQAGRSIASYRTFAGGSEAQLTSTTYDAAGRVVTQSDHLTGSARTTTYHYDAAGRLDLVTRPNHVVTTTTYDVLSRVAHVTNTPDTGQSALTFSATGASQSFTVPTGVNTVTVDALGAQGGGVSGGLGGEATSTIPVAAAESLQVNVGTQGWCGQRGSIVDGNTAGGWNGGGAGGGVISEDSGCGGGGASDVRRGGTATGDRKVVAGGGGGPGGGSYGSPMAGGGGGGTSGQDGSANLEGSAKGAGGTPSAGGAGGTGTYPGTAGTLGDGGHPTSGTPAGGGGGGLYGGGGGSMNGGGTTATGGGGGSGFVSGIDTAMTTGVHAGAGTVTLSWDSLPDLVYRYSLGGRVTTRTTDARPVTYSYDPYGRLVTTVDGATTRSYVYDDNSNRCRLGAGTGCDSANWAYDSADRITKSPYASAYTYDSGGHGNVVATTGTSGNPSATIGYDALDHATTVNDGTTTVTETLAPSGRVLRRVVTTNSTGAVTEDTSFGYAGGGDSPAYSRPTSGGTITTYLGELTDVGGTSTWALSNGHGDILGTTTSTGAFTAVPQADEFGVGTTPTSRLGWLGQQQRRSVGGALGLVRMGVRLYDPQLGRFLEFDPVLGGSANDYDYCNGDPINCFDLGGTTTAKPSMCRAVFDFEHPICTVEQLKEANRAAEERERTARLQQEKNSRGTYIHRDYLRNDNVIGGYLAAFIGNPFSFAKGCAIGSVSGYVTGTGLGLLLGQPGAGGKAGQAVGCAVDGWYGSHGPPFPDHK